MVQMLAVSLDDPSVEVLLAGLHDEYLTRYGPGDEMARASAVEFEPPAGLFLIAVDDERTVAGGGFRRYGEGVCEVKRMWTAPTHRRRGLAWQVLDELERRAAEAGYTRLVLETGPKQPEAAAMYERRGYRRIAPFGCYPGALGFETDLVAAASS